MGHEGVEDQRCHMVETWLSGSMKEIKRDCTRWKKLVRGAARAVDCGPMLYSGSFHVR